MGPTPSQVPAEAAQGVEAQHVPWPPTAQWGSDAGTSAAQEDQAGSPPPRISSGPPPSPPVAPHPHRPLVLPNISHNLVDGPEGTEQVPGNSPHPLGSDTPPTPVVQYGQGLPTSRSGDGRTPREGFGVQRGQGRGRGCPRARFTEWLGISWDFLKGVSQGPNSVLRGVQGSQENSS